MSNLYLSALRKVEGIQGPSRAILMVLADHANDDGQCWPSISTIAREGGVAKRTVINHLSTLETRGILTRTKRFNKERANQSNIYALSMTKLKEMRPPSEGDAPPLVQEMHPPSAEDAPKASIEASSRTSKEARSPIPPLRKAAHGPHFSETAFVTHPSEEEAKALAIELRDEEIKSDPFCPLVTFCPNEVEEWAVDWHIRAEQSGWLINDRPMRNVRLALRGYLRKAAKSRSKRFKEFDEATCSDEEPPF